MESDNYLASGELESIAEIVRTLNEDLVFSTLSIAEVPLIDANGDKLGVIRQTPGGDSSAGWAWYQK